MNTENIARDALRKAAERLTPQFWQEAINAGWPSDVVYQLTVEEVDGNLQISIPDAIKDRVYNLEYGDSKSLRANRVIYRFEQSHTEGTNDIFETAFEDLVSDLGAFN